MRRDPQDLDYGAESEKHEAFRLSYFRLWAAPIARKMVVLRGQTCHDREPSQTTQIFVTSWGKEQDRISQVRGWSEPGRVEADATPCDAAVLHFLAPSALLEDLERPSSREYFSICQVRGATRPPDWETADRLWFLPATADIEAASVPPPRSISDQIDDLYVKLNELLSSDDPARDANVRACVSQIEELEAREADVVEEQLLSRLSLPKQGGQEALAAIDALVAKYDDTSCPDATAE